MRGIAAIKPENGKLLRAKVHYEGSQIISVQLTGDFFFFPNEKFSLLEEAFVGKSIYFVEMDMENELAEAVKKNSLQLIGISPEAISKAVKMAISNVVGQ